MFTPEYSGTYYLQTVMTGKKGAFLSGDKSFTASSNIITIVVTNPAGNYTTWSPVNKIDNLNRDFFVLCHD